MLLDVAATDGAGEPSAADGQPLVNAVIAGRVESRAGAGLADLTVAVVPRGAGACEELAAQARTGRNGDFRLVLAGFGAPPAITVAFRVLDEHQDVLVDDGQPAFIWPRASGQTREETCLPGNGRGASVDEVSPQDRLQSCALGRRRLFRSRGPDGSARGPAPKPIPGQPSKARPRSRGQRLRPQARHHERTHSPAGITGTVPVLPPTRGCPGQTRSAPASWAPAGRARTCRNLTAGTWRLTAARLHWAVAGVGPAVVAIHDGLADLRMRERLVPALAESYDLRGLGCSEPPTGPVPDGRRRRGPRREAS